MAAPPDAEADTDVDAADTTEPVEREGHETLLPSAPRSVMRKATIAPPFAPPAPAQPPAGQERRGARSGDVIGARYVVEGQLGRGGMGRVMRVRHAVLGKAFALKLIKSAIATEQRVRELFYREARVASTLAHDNICSIVDFGQDDTFGLFMVMELLEGQTVHAKIRHSGRFPPKVACDVMWQVSDAIRFIHSRQILHGDIKTDNIFLVRTPAQRRLVKLLDFGLSRADLGQTDGVDGTPEYLAPERITGAPATQASELYSLGIVFFEILTGKLPFTGDIQDIYQRAQTEDVPLPSAHMGGEALDERADQIVRRATSRNPAERHPDIAAFMYELRTLMGMLGMDQTRTTRRIATEATRERRDNDHQLRAASELFAACPLPMASCDPTGRVRSANAAFLEFLGAAGGAGGVQLRDSALPDVYPQLFDDLREVAANRRQIKRIIYLNEGGDRVIEAAVLLSAAPSSAEVTAGEVHVLLHPLRTVP